MSTCTEHILIGRRKSAGRMLQKETTRVQNWLRNGVFSDASMQSEKTVGLQLNKDQTEAFFVDIEGASKLGKTMYAKRWCHKYTLKLNWTCCPDPDGTNVNPLKLKLVVFDEAAPQMVLRKRSFLAAKFCYKLPVQIATLFQCGFIDVCSSFPVIAGLAIWRV